MLDGNYYDSVGGQVWRVRFPPSFVASLDLKSFIHHETEFTAKKTIVQKIELNQLIHSFRFLPSRYAMSCCRNGDVQSVRSPTTEARFVFEKKENPTRVTKMKKKSGAKKKVFGRKKISKQNKKKVFGEKVSSRVVSCCLANLKIG